MNPFDNRDSRQKATAAIGRAAASHIPGRDLPVSVRCLPTDDCYRATERAAISLT